MSKKLPVVSTADTPVDQKLQTQNLKHSKVFTSGINCGHMSDHPKSKFNKAPCEKIIENKYGASIVLGRDRPAGLASGYGGKGFTHCASIDIVVGRPTAITKDNRPVTVDPHFMPMVDDAADAEIPFSSDSARIYISERTDLDENFGLINGSKPRFPPEELFQSGIGIKADRIAIMGEEGIKLVTRSDKHNSVGGEMLTVPAIDFIAGNEISDSLEPLVKGDRLIECLGRIFKQLEILTGDLTGVITSVIKMNTALQMHTHPSPFFGSPTGPSPQVASVGITTSFRLGGTSAKSCINQVANISGAKKLYLDDTGDRYINSRHVHTT